MYKKLQLAIIAMAVAAGSLMAIPDPAHAQYTVYYSGNPHKPWLHSRRHCLEDGGVWTRRGCLLPGVSSYRYRVGPTYYYDRPSTVYYRGGYGYWRDGIFYRY